MDILSPEDRVALWRAAVDAEGPQRTSLVRAVGKEIVDSLGALDLYEDRYAHLALETLAILDDAELFARDSMRRCLEALHEPEGGVDLLAAEMSGLLRDAAGVEHLEVQLRLRAMEMAVEWREHVLERSRATTDTISVGDLAVRYGVTTQAVYKWLRDERIEASRTPGGSWIIPAAQFEHDARPATSREQLDALKQELLRLHAADQLPSEHELGSGMRSEDGTDARR